MDENIYDIHDFLASVFSEFDGDFTFFPMERKFVIRGVEKDKDVCVYHVASLNIDVFTQCEVIGRLIETHNITSRATIYVIDDGEKEVAVVGKKRWTKTGGKVKFIFPFLFMEDDSEVDKRLAWISLKQGVVVKGVSQKLVFYNDGDDILSGEKIETLVEKSLEQTQSF